VSAGIFGVGFPSGVGMGVGMGLGVRVGTGVGAGGGVSFPASESVAARFEQPANSAQKIRISGVLMAAA
jgi:hypothetical protein